MVDSRHAALRLKFGYALPILFLTAGNPALAPYRELDDKPWTI
jgi:hypothetical protein